jgi:predicted pyridoxine 5'-phosphate oxidase superfamily flavin-nucleotide-binding protein
MNHSNSNVVTSRSAVPTPFHPGEQAVQTAVGVRTEAEARGQKMLSPQLVDAQREFFAHLPFVVVSHIDASGQPWATLLTGEPGFIQPAQDGLVRIQRGGVTGPSAFHASFLQLEKGGQVGMLGIEFARRRRNRINATVANATQQYISLQIDQGYGNCPKHISKRRWDDQLFTGDYIERLTPGMSPAAAALVQRADTFFIASSSGPTDSDAKVQSTAWGSDISHRGGEPGFLQVDGNVLSFADYPGNNLFNTLGNLQQYPQCGLLLLDFVTGEVLQIAGHASLTVDEQTGRYRVAINVTATRYLSKYRWQKHTSN